MSSGRFLREEMAGFDGMALHVLGPGAPERQRPARFRIPGVERPCAPQSASTGQAMRRPAGDVDLVVRAVEARGRAVLLADRMGALGILQRFQVGRSHLRREDRRRRAPAAERGVEDDIGCRGQQALRQRIGLGQQRPGPVAEREAGIGAGPHRFRRQDVEDGEAVDAGRMVERHAVGDAAAAVVAGDREVREAQPLHDDRHVARHGALRVGRMVQRGRRAAASPVAAKIGADHGEVAGQQRRHAAPHEVGLWKAVQQQDRGARA